MTWRAPTPLEIAQLDGDLTLVCADCNVVRAPIGLVDQLAHGRWARTPIDKLIFRCHVCRAIGRPIVKAPGNAVLGRPQLWPPIESADA